MSAAARPLKWFYHEFGLASIQDTGRNAYLIILARTCRMFAFGTNSLILGTYLTLIADKLGRRRVLMAGSILMISSGLAFAYFENFFVLLAAAILGVVSVTGGDFGPFRSIEETDVLTWYVATSTLGSSLGSEISGRLVQTLQQRDGWTDVDAYHTLFLIYTAMGAINALLVFTLTDDCELKLQDKDHSRVALDEHQELEPWEDQASPGSVSASNLQQNRSSKFGGSLVGKLFRLSAPTRSVMYRLWFLLGIDSLADGMVPYSLTNYFMDIKFHPKTSTLGDLTSVSYFLAFITSTFASPLARRIGLINTMVFTHVPSSAAVLFFPLPTHFWMTAFLLLLRTSLNPMDQAPRSAFIAAVVKPEEVTATMGITATIRTVASMLGPSFTGLLAAGDHFWVAFVTAGALRLAYDFGLWAMFVNMKVEQGGRDGSVKLDGDEERVELASLSDSDGSDIYGEDDGVTVRVK